jgi:hypothetical protein
VHAGQDLRPQRRQLVDQRCAVLGVRIVVKRQSCLLAGLQDVVVRKRRMLGADLGEEVAAGQRACAACDGSEIFPDDRETPRPFKAKSDRLGLASLRRCSGAGRCCDGNRKAVVSQPPVIAALSLLRLNSAA